MQRAFVSGEKPSYRRTLAIQVVLFLSLYAAFHIGTPSPPALNSSAFPRGPADLFFMSVRGGVRAPSEQSQLLLQMINVANIYKAKFVVNIAELGELDPLSQNATFHFPSEIPWYTTTASRGNMTGHFFKTLELPYEETLAISAIDTGSLQEVLSQEQLDENGSNMNWMKKMLATSNSNWQIVVGFDPLIICDEDGTGLIKFNKPLHDFFLESGVDAYLSKQGCAGYFYHYEGITYVANPGPSDKLHRALLINVNSDVVRGMRNGFLLHRVSPLEIESHYIDSTGEVTLKSMIHRRGREAS